MKTLIVGLGNTLAQDDGVGIYIVDSLQKSISNENIEFAICSTDIFKLMNTYANHERLIIIDAINSDLQPGSVICLKEKGLFSFEDLSRSAHQISMIEALKLMKIIQPGFDKCEIFFIGIQIGDTLLNEELSTDVRESADLIIKISNNSLEIKKQHTDYSDYTNHH